MKKEVSVFCKTSIRFRSTGDDKLDKKMLRQIEKWIKASLQDGPIYLIDDGIEYATYVPKVRSIRIKGRKVKHE